MSRKGLKSRLDAVFLGACIQHPPSHDQVLYSGIVLQDFRPLSMVSLCPIWHRCLRGSLVHGSVPDNIISMHAYQKGVEELGTWPLHRFGTVSMGYCDLQYGARLYDSSTANTTCVEASNEYGAETPRLSIVLPGLCVSLPCYAIL